MLPALGAFAPIIGSVFKTIEKSIPDKDLQEKLKAEVNLQLMKSGTEEMKASANIILQESKGSAIQANWRPCLMWLLLAIIFWNYILSPIILLFFKIKTNVELPSDVWTLLTVGLGGYTIGRSGESIARSLATRPVQSKDQENG
jgi:hypothetical protein